MVGLEQGFNMNRAIVSRYEGDTVVILRDFKPTDGFDITPKGFVSDRASTPRILWPILPPFGYYTEAAYHHDSRYVFGDSKSIADLEFRELMLMYGVSKGRASRMYKAVKLFGNPDRSVRAYRRRGGLVAINDNLEIVRALG